MKLRHKPVRMLDLTRSMPNLHASLTPEPPPPIWLEIAQGIALAVLALVGIYIVFGL
jgi:hypothetical protein